MIFVIWTNVTKQYVAWYMFKIEIKQTTFDGIDNI